MQLTGLSFVGFSEGGNGPAFQAINPATGAALEPTYFSATSNDVEQAAHLADEAFLLYAAVSAHKKGRFLRRIAAGLEARAGEIVGRAHRETALPQARLQGELTRTANQLRLFADVAEEGSWAGVRIDTANPERKPLPKPDVRSLLKPLGPVVVFGASNFPLAFSVAGGDTVSALASGCPVIVKAHPAHPGTSELTATVVREAVRDCALPEGVFSMLFDAGIEVGKALVQHKFVKAVGFTGSTQAGTALTKLAASRPEPIPCYAEMGSTNPVFVLPGAMHTQAKAIAGKLHESFTLGAGQFCTKPGLLFVPAQHGMELFFEELRTRVANMPPQVLLTAGIAEKYAFAIDKRTSGGKSVILAQSQRSKTDPPAAGTAALLTASMADFLSNEDLQEEVFGPCTLVVPYSNAGELLRIAYDLKGHLTATLHGSEEDLAANKELISVLEKKIGRLVFNGYPTGVEVCHAMVHGGAYPATSDGRSTSVGTQAIFRFVRPVCYQDFPQGALTDELKDENPLKILRMVDGIVTREACLVRG